MAVVGACNPFQLKLLETPYKRESGAHARVWVSILLLMHPNAKFAEKQLFFSCQQN